MVRTQIQLTEEQYRQVKRWAARRGISLAGAVRQCVQDRLQAEQSVSCRKEMIREALAVLGKYEDPEDRTNVAGGHDRYLAEALRG
jgi:hypothetical protein